MVLVKWEPCSALAYHVLRVDDGTRTRRNDVKFDIYRSGYSTCEQIITFHPMPQSFASQHELEKKSDLKKRNG